MWAAVRCGWRTRAARMKTRTRPSSAVSSTTVPRRAAPRSTARRTVRLDFATARQRWRLRSVRRGTWAWTQSGRPSARRRCIRPAVARSCPRPPGCRRPPSIAISALRARRPPSRWRGSRRCAGSRWRGSSATTRPRRRRGSRRPHPCVTCPSAAWGRMGTRPRVSWRCRGWTCAPPMGPGRRLARQRSPPCSSARPCSPGSASRPKTRNSRALKGTACFRRFKTAI